MTTSAALTCITCRCVFVDGDSHRAHYKCDWHRYNLKRKVAQLPPIPKEMFEAKAQMAAGIVTRESGSVDSGSGPIRCTICSGKSFGSIETLRTHEASKKHKEMVVKRGGVRPSTPDVEMPDESPMTADDTPLPKYGDNLLIQPKQPMPQDIAADEDGSEWSDESVDENEDEDIDELDAIPPTSCMFCTHTSASVEANLVHMHSKHSFSVPDMEYCVDVEGLLTWMGYKIGCGHECLWCVRTRNYHTKESCRKHMIDKGHCMLRHDAQAMFLMEEFFDFSSTHPDATEDNVDDELPEDGLVIERNYQLVLPSGAAIGHRSLCRYYKQRLRPLTQSASDKDARRLQSRALVNKLQLQYRGGSLAVAPTKIQQEMVRRKARDLHYVHAVLSKHRTQMDRRANKSFKFVGRTG